MAFHHLSHRPIPSSKRLTLTLSALLLTLLLALLFAAHAAQAEPRRAAAQWQENVNQLMRGKSDEGSVSDFLGTPPVQCRPAEDSQRLCEWHLGREHAIWQSFLEAIGTEDRFSLICRLPWKQGNDRSARSENTTDDNPPDHATDDDAHNTTGNTAGSGSTSKPADNALEDACSARPRHSNRRMFNPVVIKRKTRNMRASLSGIREELRVIAQSWLDEVRSLEEMSRLIGALPDSCKSSPGGMQTCLWRTYFATYGHGTLAASIPVSVTKKVNLVCTMLLDGSFPQGAETCRAEAVQ